MPAAVNQLYKKCVGEADAFALKGAAGNGGMTTRTSVVPKRMRHINSYARPVIKSLEVMGTKEESIALRSVT